MPFGDYAITASAHDHHDAGDSTIWYVMSVIPEDNDPPVIQEIRPAETNLEIEKETEIDFRINAVDPDRDPISFHYELDGDTVSSTSDLTYMFADTGRFVITAFATDWFGVADSVAWTVRVFNPASLGESGEVLPAEFAITSLHPNPFNAEFEVTIALSVAGQLRIELFDLLGRSAATFTDSPYPAGWHNLSFNTSTLPSGVYFLRVCFPDGGRTVTRAVVLK